MGKRVVDATIPLSPSLINMYCQANAAGDNDIIFNFDLEECELSNAHVLGYLSNLKIPFWIENHSPEFLLEYIRTPFFVGESNMILAHKMALETGMLDKELVLQHRALIFSLPKFIVQSSSATQERKNAILYDGLEESDHVFTDIGPNIAYLMQDSQLVIEQLRGDLFAFAYRPYYTHYFDEHIYGGDKLIKFFDEDHLLIKAIQPILQ